MSFKSKAQSLVFIGRAKSVFCNVILFDFVFQSSLSEDYMWCKFVVSNWHFGGNILVSSSKVMKVKLILLGHLDPWRWYQYVVHKQHNKISSNNA